MLAKAPDDRVVVDTNVWISALVFGGGPRQVFERIVETGTTLVTSAEISTEIRRTLSRKFPDFVADYEMFAQVLLPMTAPATLGTLTVEACRDPDDDRVLETALLGRAPYIVSGDKDLLALDPFVWEASDPIHILRPQSWLDR